MNKIMLSCKKSTELIEQSQEKKLSFKNRVQLSLHLMACNTCKAYAQQSKTINMAIIQFLQKDKTDDKNTIKNDDLKEKIISKL